VKVSWWWLYLVLVVIILFLSHCAALLLSDLLIFRNSSISVSGMKLTDLYVFKKNEFMNAACHSVI